MVSKQWQHVLEYKFVWVVREELQSYIQALYHLFIICMYVLNPLRDSLNRTSAVQTPEYESKTQSKSLTNCNTEPFW